MIALDSLTLDGGALSAGLVAVAAVLALRRKKGASPEFASKSPQTASAAEEANRYYRAMVEHSWDAVVVADAKGVICFASDAVWRVFGIPANQALGVQVADLLDRKFHPQFMSSLALCLATPGETAFGEYLAAGRGTPPLWLDVVAINRLADPLLGGILLHLRDVTDRKAQQAVIDRLERTRRLAAAISRTLVQRPAPRKLLEQACATAVVHGQFSLAFAVMFEEGQPGGAWMVQRASNARMDAAVALLSNALDSLQLTTLMAELNGGRYVVDNDLRSGEIPNLAHSGSSAISPTLQRVAELGLLSVGCWPLHVDGRLLGILTLAASETEFFNDQEGALLTELASDIAFGMDSYFREQDRAAVRLQAERDHARLVALAELNNLPESMESIEMMRWVVEHAAALSNSETAFLHVLSPEGDQIVQSMWNKLTMQLCTSMFASHSEPSMAGLWADCIRTKLPVLCNDYQQLSKDGALPEGHFTLNRFVAVPATSGQVVRLVLGVGNKPSIYDESDVRNTALLAEALWAILRRRQDQQALRDGEALYREMFAASPLPMFQFDAHSLAVLRMNDAAQAKFGFQPAQLANLTASDLVVPAERERLQHAVAGKESQFQADAEWQMVGALGKAWLGQVISHALEASGGTRQAMVIDVTSDRQAEAQTARHVRELELSNRSAIQVISTIGELRDPYTQGHEQRVGALAAAIGREMGLAAQEVEGLQISGWLHDVGKIALPTEILSKPGRLTALEFELIKQHPEQGYAILKGLNTPWPVALVALQHHERMDGSGYPKGLRGQEICLSARILAVADVVEAMASHRPYRAAMGLQAGLAEIERGRGLHYDPTAVDACLALMRRGQFDFDSAVI